MDPCEVNTEEKCKKVHKGKEFDKVPLKLTGTEHKHANDNDVCYIQRRFT